ncbi:hypothetical protein J7K28_00045 [Candidatus Aerophobetes bacterium]|nr:hypothetical protein [Candidatus Aerophobetes bacterium]
MISKIEQEMERVSRHIAILKIVIAQGPIGIIKISELTKYPQHKVRYSLRILERENLIKPSSQGAIPTPKARRLIKILPERVKPIIKKLEDL